MFTGLSVVAFLLFVVVLILLVRNMLKLYADQRSRVMGARLRTRMFWGAVLVSFLPIAFMFAFSYLLMNRAVDRWFSQPVTQMRDDSNHMALALAQYTTANARAEADSIASSITSAIATVGSEQKSVVPTRGSDRSRQRELAARNCTSCSAKGSTARGGAFIPAKPRSHRPGPAPA